MSRLIKKADSAEDLVNTPTQTTEPNAQPNVEQNTEQVPAPQGEAQPAQPVENDGVQVAVDLLKRVNNSVDDIKEAYYSLLDNLNAVNESYPNVYNEFKQLVKLPNETDVKTIVQLQSDVQDAVKYLSDPSYLSGFITKH